MSCVVCKFDWVYFYTQRHTLAQLRTNKSPILTLYLYKVDATNHTTPLCPLRKIQEHDTTHLFTCTKLYTPMTVLDLWTDPVKVIPLLEIWRDRLSAYTVGQLGILYRDMRVRVDHNNNLIQSVLSSLIWMESVYHCDACEKS